jgi:hypothetical protein
MIDLMKENGSIISEPRDMEKVNSYARMVFPTPAMGERVNMAFGYQLEHNPRFPVHQITLNLWANHCSNSGDCKIHVPVPFARCSRA